MPFLRVDSLKFFYQQSGTGPDVVLIHGITGNMAIWPLIDVIRALAVDFRVTYYDLRGHGYSDTPPTGYTSADMAEDLYKIQGALGLGPSYLVGHSFGGVIAMHAAVLHPEAVAGIVLSDPYFPGLRHLEKGVPSWSGWQEYKQQCARAGLEISDDSWFDVGDILTQAVNLSPDKRAMFEKEMSGPALQRLVRLAATTCGDDVKKSAGLDAERIVSVRQPIVALYGEHSPFLATCRFLKQNMTDCTVAIVPGTQHLAHEENPASYVELACRHLRMMAGIPETLKATDPASAGGLP